MFGVSRSTAWSIGEHQRSVKRNIKRSAEKSAERSIERSTGVEDDPGGLIATGGWLRPP